MKAIGSKIVEATGEKRSTPFLLQRLISLSLQRGNATCICILGTLPPGTELNEIS